MEQEVHAYHDFTSKLLQQSLVPGVVDYVRWQQARRAAQKSGEEAPAFPNRAPVSINLDLTTACNYRCDHCIDWDILNTGVKHDETELKDSLKEMAARGMRSVILIGGGEPSVHPRFVELVAYLKRDLKQQVAVVSNGSRGDKLLEAAEYFTKGDWVRLSLDSGTDATFQAMHKPRGKVVLEEICSWVPKIKDKNPDLQMGFSFIVTWLGAQRGDVKIVENIHEIHLAAELARANRFDYISIKPYLERTDVNGSEVMEPHSAQEEIETVIARIRASVAEAKKLETETFTVVESTNLRVLENQTWEHYTKQPRQCHMQVFRQVLTPHGVFNCPAHRSQPRALVTGRNGYKSDEKCEQSQNKLAILLDNFDASKECEKVTCLYHETNWFIEQLIENPEKLDELNARAERGDYFL